MEASAGIDEALDAVSLRILATSDLHGHLRAYDYVARREDPSVGLSRAATLIAGLRAEAPNSLLVDCGDFLTGGPFEADGAAPHPVIAAMNALGFDAGTLGNHEFDLGAARLQEVLAASAFPVLSANAVRRLGHTPLDDVPFTAACHLLRADVTDAAGHSRSLAIGLVGFTPPVAAAAGGADPGIACRGILEAARAWIPELRRRGADLVVALCHSGIGAAKGSEEDAALELALAGGIDAMVLGHRHRVFPGPDHAAAPGIDPDIGTLHGVPAVMPGAWGRQVGVIDLTLRPAAWGWRVARFAVRCHPIAERGPDGIVRGLVPCAPAVLAATEPAHAAHLAAADPVIGSLPFALHTYFSRLGHCPVSALLAGATARAVARALAGGAFAGLPVVGLAAPMRAGGLGGPENYIDIPAGPLRQRHLAALYPFPNRVAGLLATGAVLRAWLERSVSAFATVVAGEFSARLIDPRFPVFDFDMAPDLDIAVDLTRRPAFDARGARTGAGGRIARLAYRDGRPVDDAAPLILAVNDYRAAGGGRFPGAGTGAVVARCDTDMRDAIRALFCDDARPPMDRRTFAFVPVRDAFVRFRTGAGSLAHLSDLGGFPLIHEEPLETGFHAFTLDLGAVPRPAGT